MSLGEGDSRNPFPKTPGPMLTRRLKPDGYSKVKGRGKTISRARKILSSAQKIIRSAPRRREKRMARAIFWGATVFRNAANGPEKFQFRIAILARGVCAKSLDVSFVAPSNPRGKTRAAICATGTWSRDLRLILRDVTPQIVGHPDASYGAALVASLSQAAAIATEMQKGCDSRRKARGKTAGAHLGGSLGGHRIVMGIC